MANISIESKKAEGLRRLHDLCERFHLGSRLEDQLKRDKLYYSYGISMDTIAWDERYPRFVETFQDRYDCYVYHAIESNTAMGKMLSLLYVSDDRSDWPEEEYGEYGVMTFTFIVDAPDGFSDGEFGSIGLGAPMGYLARTW